MTFRTIRPLLELKDDAASPLYPAIRRPVLVVAGALAIVAIGLLLSFAARDIGTKLAMGLPAITLVLCGVAAWRQATTERLRLARILTLQSCIRFVPPAGQYALWLAAWVSGTIVGVTAWWLVAAGLLAPLSREAVWMTIIGIAALVELARSLATLRLPPGLTLDVAGISGVRGSRAVFLTWDDLAGIEMARSRTGAQFIVVGTDGSTTFVDSRQIASDPRIVALVVEHYLHHPEDRDELNTPHEAVARIREGHLDVEIVES